MNVLARTRTSGLLELKEPVEALIRHVAQSVLMVHYRQLRHADISEKTPGEVVTIADHMAEEMLTEGLAAILPGSRVIGEEACSFIPDLLAGQSHGLVWVVDPLDGTAHFAAGREPFGIMVALAMDGVTIAAWIYNPVPDRMHYAVLGQGAYVTQGGAPPARMFPLPPVGRPIAALATQFMPETLRNSVITAGSAAFELQPIPRCAAEHYPRLCRGDNHVALFQRTLSWDHAAGALLLTESGGYVARWNGTPYHFHDSALGILAATSRELWEAAADVLLADGLLHAEGHRLLPPNDLPATASRSAAA